MERNNRELSMLEYLIRLRALSFSKKAYFYLTIKQRICFLGLTTVMDCFEAEQNKKTVTMSELISETKSFIEQNINVLQKRHGTWIGKTFSKEVIRSVIYGAIPLYFYVTQHGRAKIISLTPKAKQFVSWKNQTYVSSKTGKKIVNSRLWVTRHKINYVEENPSANNYGVEYNGENN